MDGFERDIDLRIAAGNEPLTREVVDFYVRRGQQLRAEMMRRGFRRLRAAIAGRRRLGAVQPGPAH